MLKLLFCVHVLPMILQNYCVSQRYLFPKASPEYYKQRLLYASHCMPLHHSATSAAHRSRASALWPSPPALDGLGHFEG